MSNYSENQVKIMKELGFLYDEDETPETEIEPTEDTHSDDWGDTEGNGGEGNED